MALKLSKTNFARQPVDQALESKNNADAASRRTGISSFFQNQGAVHRWTATLSVRSNIVKNLLERSGLKHPIESPSHELRSCEVAHFQSDLGKLHNMIESTMNPLSVTD